MTPSDTISAALRSIGALALGETAGPDAANAAFGMLNDMLDNWSAQHLAIYYQNEVFHELTPAQYIYTIGPNGMVGCSFTGSIALNVLTVTAIASGAINIGQAINGVQAGTTITALGTGQQGNGTSALGTYLLNFSQTVASGPLTSYQPRPIRINSAFVRVATLDYPVKVMSFEDYEKVGLKSLNGPWPYGVYYQPAEPVGTLNYWPNPSSGEVHLFCDSLLGNFQTLADVVTIPQGYAMAMRWNLAELLMPEYGRADQGQVQMVMKNAANSLAWVKRVNARPQQEQQFDQALLTGIRKDSGWIMHGGFL